MKGGEEMNLIGREASIKIYLDIFMAFLRPGTLTFGGGPSAIPLIQEEVVERYGWLTVQEFTDALALGNSLPGPIATKMSALIGYKVSGWLGALIGLVAMVAPTALAIIFLVNSYMKFKEAAWLKGMMTAVRPVVVVLVAQVVWIMGQKSFLSIHTTIIAGVAAIGLMVLKIHPALLIISALCYGGIFLK